VNLYFGDCHFNVFALAANPPTKEAIMPKATPVKEVIVTCPNKVGALSKVASALAEARVNVDACCCYSEGGATCNLHFVTPDPTKTLDLCNKSGWTAKVNDVVCCELNNTVGTLASATTALATAGVDIQYCYCSTGNGSATKVYLCTADNDKALKTLG
jgi:hypothetical protein